jgi:hypothetical protein
MAAVIFLLGSRKVVFFSFNSAINHQLMEWVDAQIRNKGQQKPNYKMQIN